MGRPRKQPRRVMTFNINESTAQRIDNLNLSNRSEWANKALLDVMDSRIEEREALLDRHNEKTIKKIEDDLLIRLSDDPHRLATMLFMAIQRIGLDDVRIKGRYTLSEQLRLAIQSKAFQED